MEFDLGRGGGGNTAFLPWILGRLIFFHFLAMYINCFALFHVCFMTVKNPPLHFLDCCISVLRPTVARCTRRCQRCRGSAFYGGLFSQDALCNFLELG